MGWFVVAIVALVMSISAFRSTRLPEGEHEHHGQQIPSATMPFNPSPASPNLHPSLQPLTPSAEKHPSSAAGGKLLKCMENDQVTYTNNPQDCPVGTVSNLTVYPTKGYLPMKP